MKKSVKLGLSLVLAATTQMAVADVKNFTGPSIGLGLGLGSTTEKVTTSAGALQFEGGKDTMPVNLQAAYGFALGADSVATVGLTYDVLNSTVGGYDAGSGLITLKQSRQYSVFVAPGVLVAPSTLAYGKLSYSSLGLKWSRGGESSKKSFTGFGYGVGLATMVSKDVIVSVEAMRVGYGKKVWIDETSSTKPTSTTGMVTIGFKF